jgi:hypothetical protein
MFLIRQSRRALGIAIALICLFPSLAKGQFFEESAVWEGTDSIGREVVLYISPEGRFFSQYPLLISVTSDGHGIWSIDPADNTIRFRSLSEWGVASPIELISRRYTVAKGQEGAILMTAGDTGHQLTLKPSADSPAFLPEELIEYSVEVPKDVFYDPADPVGRGLNLDSWTPYGVVFSDSTGSEISLEGADQELFRVQRNEVTGHTLVYLAQSLPVKEGQSGYELSIVRQPALAKRPIVAAANERYLIHVNPGDNVVGGLPPIFALPPIFLGPESDSPLKIQFFGANNYTVSVQASADLASWKTVESIEGRGETIEWLDSRNDRPSNLFYRIQLIPKALAAPGAFGHSGGKPLEPSGELAKDLANIVQAKLDAKGRSITGSTVASVVEFLPPIFAPTYLIELRGDNEQGQPVSVYAEVTGAGIPGAQFVTKVNVDDRWEVPLRTELFEADAGLSVELGISDANRFVNSAEFALAELNERTEKNWSLVDVISSVEMGAETEQLFLSIATPEGEMAMLFVEVGMNPDTNESEVLTAFTQSELGVTVVPIELVELAEPGDADFVAFISESAELNLVKTDSPLAKRLAEFLLGQEPAAKVGLKSKRIVAITQAKTEDSLSYFVELLASTEAGATVLIQAHVNELDEGQLGLISFQIVERG